VVTWNRTAAVVAVLIAASSASVLAADQTPPERWLIARAMEGALAYDGASRDGDPNTETVFMRVALYFDTPHAVATPSGGSVANSYQLIDAEFDCMMERYRAVDIAFLDANGDEQGYTLNETAPWKELDADYELFFNVACLDGGIARTVEAGSIDEMLAKMKTVR
jgi:hypothetical protein